LQILMRLETIRRSPEQNPTGRLLQTVSEKRSFRMRPIADVRHPASIAGMKRLAAAIVSASVVSCTTLPSATGVQRYAELEGLVGQEVTLAGYWSMQHEATGIYFGKREYYDAPEQCVMVEPSLTSAHRSPVRVSGILERSGCGEELICLTVCQPYVLKNAHIVR